MKTIFSNHTNLSRVTREGLASSSNQRTSMMQQQQHHPQKQKDKVSNHFIQSNSIQYQFTQLSNDRDKFRKERIVANNNVEEFQKQHLELKQEQETLITQNVQAKASQGELSNKLRLLQEDVSRLNRLIDNEHSALQQCTNHIKQLETKKINMKKQLIKEMNPINNEIASLLQNKVEKGIEQYLTVEAITAHILPHLNDKEAAAAGISNVQAKDIYENYHHLKEMTTIQNEKIVRLQQIKNALQERGLEWKDIMLSTKKTNNASPADGDNNTENTPKHMDLFYGSQDNKQNDDMEVDNDFLMVRRD